MVTRGHGAGLRGLVLTSFGILATWAFHNALLLPWETEALPAGLRQPLLLAFRALVWLGPIAVYLQRHEARPPLVALGITSRIDVRGMLPGALPGVLYLTLAIAITAAGSGVPLPELVARSLRTLNPGSAYMIISIAFEEILMRGFLLNQLCRRMSSWLCQGIVAMLFAAMHLPGWIAMQGWSIELLPMSISLALLGLVLGIVARSSRSILPAIVLHCVNNVLAQ
jgi:membrane protease YdiL (CAAX protease family)